MSVCIGISLRRNVSDPESSNDTQLHGAVWHWLLGWNRNRRSRKNHQRQKVIPDKHRLLQTLLFLTLGFNSAVSSYDFSLELTHRPAVPHTSAFIWQQTGSGAGPAPRRLPRRREPSPSWRNERAPHPPSCGPITSSRATTVQSDVDWAATCWSDSQLLKVAN